MSKLSALKAVAVHALTASGASRLLRPLNRDAAVVFMLHRFTDPSRGVVGDDPAHVRELLAYLRRERYAFVPLEELLQSLAGERPPRDYAISFTIDDGYAEQAAIGGPLFAEFDCPVTTFVTTGFLDGKLWFWWDQIEYIVRTTTVASVTISADGATLTFALATPANRIATQAAVTMLCKSLSNDRKDRLIAELAAAAEVTIPSVPPASYAPMTWDDLRRCERGGMTFGPHTVTHPILARVDGDRAHQEIIQSWQRLRAEAAAPVAIFAYPNGQPGDFGPREFRILQQAGLRAVTGSAGFATVKDYRQHSGPLLVPRFSFPDSLPYLVQLVGGLERLKTVFRR